MRDCPKCGAEMRWKYLDAPICVSPVCFKKKIQVGDFIRSYDFEHTDQFFVEGEIVAIDHRLGVERYKILVHRWHVDGHDAANFTDYVYPETTGRVELIG